MVLPFPHVKFEREREVCNILTESEPCLDCWVIYQLYELTNLLLLLLPTVLPSLFIRFSLLGAPCETLLDYNDKFMPITLIAARDLAD